MKMKSACIAVLFAWLGLFTATPLADDDSCGNQRTENDGIVSATAWDELTSCGVTLSAGHAHRCVVTACADAAIPVGSVNNDYRFVVSTAVTGPGLGTGWERNIQLNDNPGVNDAGVSVCTVRMVSVSSSTVARTVTFYWLARKVAESDATMIVDDSSIGVTCTDGA